MVEIAKKLGRENVKTGPPDGHANGKMGKPTSAIKYKIG